MAFAVIADRDHATTKVVLTSVRVDTAAPRQKCNLRKYPYWTSDDIGKLVRLAGNVPTAQLATELGRGRAATIMKAHQLGVSLRIWSKRANRVLKTEELSA